ncbi:MULTISPECIES: ABC transporter substrate-binding protein [Geobacillus]|uniref:ABC transporter substrate-binding protein n=1 Tax=Geobacillus TaxID=129337 RepID=UPI0002AF41B6|nr:MULTISPECIES: sugar ABC transporter substrate-binding protein [Geobacillus]AGE22476.1 Extracellular solute-binding protein family 1 [Geobacillus sp. GHH01]WKA45976.1 sugar ABC transporter substrate-binding protein [Geobacillus zalihae]
MRKKQSIIMIILLTTFLIVLGGCSSNNKTAQGEGESKTVTLKFMGWEASPLETEAVKKGLQKFMEENPNIRVQYTPIPQSQYSSKLLTMLAGNAAPDVFFLGSEDYRTFQKKGVLLDLTPYFKEEYSIDDFIPSAASIMQIDGKIFGVSSCTVSPVLFYNKKLFDEAGIPYPSSDPQKAWTWKQFVEVAKKLTKKNGDKVEQFGVFGLENNYMTVAEYFSNGGSPYNNSFTKSTFNTPEVKQVLQSVLDLRVKYGVAPETSVLEKIGMRPTQMLQTGKIGMLIDGSWSLQELASMKFPVGVAPLPKFKEAVTHGQAHVHAVSAKTKYPKEAWKLVSFLSSEEYQIQLVKEGLWMPNRKALYTNEGIKKWYNKEVHPEGFEKMVTYFENAKPYPNAFLSNNKITSIITEELDKFYYNGESLDKVVERIDNRSNEELRKQRD